MRDESVRATDEKAENAVAHEHNREKTSARREAAAGRGAVTGRRRDHGERGISTGRDRCRRLCARAEPAAATGRGRGGEDQRDSARAVRGYLALLNGDDSIAPRLSAR